MRALKSEFESSGWRPIGMLFLKTINSGCAAHLLLRLELLVTALFAAARWQWEQASEAVRKGPLPRAALDRIKMPQKGFAGEVG